jgi:hypothetical protein
LIEVTTLGTVHVYVPVVVNTNSPFVRPAAPSPGPSVAPPEPPGTVIPNAVELPPATPIVAVVDVLAPPCPTEILYVRPATNVLVPVTIPPELPPPPLIEGRTPELPLPPPPTSAKVALYIGM